MSSESCSGFGGGSGGIHAKISWNYRAAYMGGNGVSQSSVERQNVRGYFLQLWSLQQGLQEGEYDC